MFVVYIGTEKHSAWDTLTEARNQIRVLKEAGYTDVRYEYEDGAHYENGQYFV